MFHVRIVCMSQTSRGVLLASMFCFLPSTAKNLIATNPCTSHIYFLPKIHKNVNPGRPIVSACSCPTELISSYSDSAMLPIVKSLPTNHALSIFNNFRFSDNSSKFLFTMDVKSLYTVIPNAERDFAPFVIFLIFVLFLNPVLLLNYGQLNLYLLLIVSHLLIDISS